MHRKLFTSLHEREQLFHTELVKCGVEYHKAAKAAQIIVSETSDDLLTDDEIQLVKDVCQQWLEQRKRLGLIHNILASTLSKSK